MLRIMSRHRVATIGLTRATILTHGYRRLPRRQAQDAEPGAAAVALRRRHDAGRPRDPGADAFAGGADPRARQPPGRRRRQAHAAAADGRGGAAVRLCRHRRPPHQARDLRRVHPFRHAAARRRGRCQRAAARQAVGQLGVGRQGLGAGRRLPVHARLRADGRCRLARHPGRAVARLLDHRRGRGAAAREPARHQHARGDLSRGDQGQDRQTVRRGRRSRRHGRRPQRARAGGAARASA